MGLVRPVMSPGVSLLSAREVRIRASRHAEHAVPEPPGRAISSAAAVRRFGHVRQVTGEGIPILIFHLGL